MVPKIPSVPVNPCPPQREEHPGPVIWGFSLLYPRRLSNIPLAGDKPIRYREGVCGGGGVVRGLRAEYS